MLNQVQKPVKNNASWLRLPIIFHHLLLRMLVPVHLLMVLAVYLLFVQVQVIFLDDILWFRLLYCPWLHLLILIHLLVGDLSTVYTSSSKFFR